MTTRDALLRAVLAAPDDDLPRLVFADYCDENGDQDRAEFIRVQCELMSCKWQHDLIEPRGRPLIARETKLVNAKPTRYWFERFDGEWQVMTDSEVKDGRRLDTRVPWFIVRRGFVDELRIPTLAALLGGDVCRRCWGEKTFEKHGHDYPCSRCNYTGRMPGVLKQMFSAHPVTGVAVQDREPLRFTPDSGSSSFDYPDLFAWGRQGQQSLTETHWIPDEVWRRIPCDDVRAERYKRFDTRQQANAALSAGIVALGREKAGLPALNRQGCRSEAS